MAKSPAATAKTSSPTALLAAADPALARLIDRVGPCTLRPDRKRTPFQGLVHAVAHQQLNGKAASTILARFRALFDAKAFPTPETVADTPAERLTGVGFSRAKASYIHEIARHAVTGALPTRSQMRHMTDDAIVERLTAIRGVGRWSVEMFLIFGLGRPDILPIHDFGVRRGFMLTYGRRKMPDPEAVLRHGERWRPHRTVASWYLWRATELD